MGTIQLLYGLVLLAVFIFKAEMVNCVIYFNINWEILNEKWNLFQEFKSFDINLLSPIPSMANCVFYVYLYSYYGDDTNKSFENISILLYQADWIKLPNDLRKTIMLMMQYAQQPMFYTTFGGFPLNVDTLGRVRRIPYFWI